MNAVALALQAVMAFQGGDVAGAREHIVDARCEARTATRRDRQIVEIASLVIAGGRSRAVGLAQMHTTEFPDDAKMLALIGETTR